MKVIEAGLITETVAALCIDANLYLNCDVRKAFEEAKKTETDGLSADILGKLLENADIAEEKLIPICQDTGMAVVFIEIGQDVRVNGPLTDAVNAGVAMGYEKGYLRKSVVKDPIDRVNTKNNTPAVIHYDIVPGDALRITVAPKGFGSENMSRLKMFTPSAGIDGVKNFVLETVREAGPNACPPLIVGVGVGGTMEKAALIAKRALLRKVGEKSENAFWACVENELLEKINALKIGPGGFGGRTTALSVNINAYPTHIAGLPVAVNLGCHFTRHSEAVL